MDNDQVAYFTEISANECRELLKDAVYGRIAWQGEDGILVFPVNYQLWDGHVVFHTAPGTVLAAIAEDAEVAFQVDDVDEEQAIGWTVSLLGRTRAAPPECSPLTWMPTKRTLGIMIEERALSGRAIAGMRKV